MNAKCDNSKAEKSRKRLVQSLDNARISGRFSKVLCWVSFIACSTSYAEASAGGAKATLDSLFVPSINVAVYIAILTLLLWKPVKRAFAERAQEFQRKAKEADSRLTFEEKRHVQLAKRLSELTAEIDAIKKEYKQDTELLVREMEQKAVEKCERISLSVEETLSAEQRSGERELRDRTIDEVMSVAKDKIQQTLTAETDRKNRVSGIENVRRIV
jgi:F0F1-type ATP synthase membrane subunit b/b'